MAGKRKSAAKARERTQRPSEADVEIVQRAIEESRLRPQLDPAIEAIWHLRLQKMQIDFEAGDKRVLFAALYLCAHQLVVMPDWVRDAFITGYEEVRAFKKKSWDDAFGSPFPKGKKLAAHRKRHNLARRVWTDITIAHDEHGRAIDEQLFEEVGATLGIGKTLTAEYYYFHRARVEEGRTRRALFPLLHSELRALPGKSKTSRKYTVA